MTFLPFAVLVCLLSACRTGQESPKPALSLDPGFEALFPAVTTALVQAWGKSQDPGGPGPSQAAIVVASPYSAERILQPSAATPGGKPDAGSTQSAAPASAGTPLTRCFIVPFAAPGLLGRADVWTVGYDYGKAYAAMGTEAAAVLSPGHGRKRTKCAIVFQPNFMRGEPALEAFSAAFEAKAGPGRLAVKRLPTDPDAVDAGGNAADAIREVAAGDVGLVILAIDWRTQASTAAATAAGIRGDERIVYFADMSGWGDAKVGRNLFAWRIEGNESGLAKALIGLARFAASGGTGGGIATCAELVALRIRKPFPGIF